MADLYFPAVRCFCEELGDGILEKHGRSLGGKGEGYRITRVES
jgi:hypothetical protein